MTKSTRMSMIAQVLTLAANEFLAPSYDANAGKSKEFFSCDAAVSAGHALGLHSNNIDKVLDFLKELGVDINSTTQFKEFEPKGTSDWRQAITKQTQSVRYAWLMFAAMIAAEEGK